MSHPNWVNGTVNAIYGKQVIKTGTPNQTLWYILKEIDLGSIHWGKILQLWWKA